MAKTERRRKSQGLPRPIELAVRAAEDKKAGFTDHFVICSGSNVRQLHAIADAVVEALADHGKPAHVEGYNRSDRSGWILIDYFDFIVHVFAPDTRLFYGLERLWGSAERVEIPPAR